jgi:hypothetical protein
MRWFSWTALVVLAPGSPGRVATAADAGGVDSARPVPPPREGALCTPTAGRLLTGEAFSFRAKVELGFEHGCSMSIETAASITDLVMTVSDKDEATIIAETFEGETVGPSLGEFRKGSGQFIHRSTRVKKTWRGRTFRLPGLVRLEIERVETAVDASGGINYGPATAEKLSHEIVCRESGLLVGPAWNSVRTGEKSPPSTCARTLACEGLYELVPIKDERLQQRRAFVLPGGALPLLPGSGIDINSKSFHGDDWNDFRRASR